MTGRLDSSPDESRAPAVGQSSTLIQNTRACQMLRNAEVGR
jgi:hypothetical protein